MFKYVSLFSGAGGLDVGLERAGFEPISLCEIEKTFCDTAEANRGWQHCDGRSYFASAAILNADIRDVSATDLTRGHESIDLVVGGPPCQAFSSSGKQLSVLDPRGALVSEFCRIVDQAKPRMFLFENVRGLVTARDKTGEPGGVIRQLVEILQDLGYSCRAELLNSADYGSHQRRVRCFIIGTRRGLSPQFPQPSHSRVPSIFERPWQSLGNFLAEHADQQRENYVRPTPLLARMLEDIPDGSGLKSPGRAETTRPGGHWGYRQGTFIANLTLPARTVTGSASQDWVRWQGELRRLTLQEVKLLQGFPRDWIVKGSKAHQFKQVGNAVPTIFGELLGGTLRAFLLDEPRSSPIRIDLPKSFYASIDYTKRDHAKNSSSRSVHKAFA